MMSKPAILIIGINSFLGKAIAAQLGDSFHITGVYHQKKENIDEKIKLTQMSELEKLIYKKFKIIYLVSSYVPDNEEVTKDDQLIEANIALPRRLASLFPDSRIIFCSSVAVFENNSSNRLTKDSFPSPATRYGISKLWGEKIIQQHQSYGILRISSIYGIGMKSTTFLPRIIDDALQKGEINLMGKGERVQNYIHVDDVAKTAIKLGMLNRNVQVMAVSDRNFSNLEIAEMVQKLTDCKINFRDIDPTRSFVYDNKSSKKIIGSFKDKNIVEGIIEMITWRKKMF